MVGGNRHFSHFTIHYSQKKFPFSRCKDTNFLKNFGYVKKILFLCKVGEGPSEGL